MPPKIAKIVVGLPVEGPFDYSVPMEFRESIRVGQRVGVSFNRRVMVGFVVGFLEKSKFAKLNPILTFLDKQPSLNEKTLHLTKKFSDYYGCSWGEAIETYLPDMLRKKTLTDLPADPISASTGPAAPKEKNSVLLHALDQEKAWAYLSEQIHNAVIQKKSVIILAPEIFMVDEIHARLKKSLSHPVCLIDRHLTAKQQFENWLKIKKGDFQIIVGTRSAVFAPAVDPGLIIIYDEENPAYKQEQSPFYRAHDVAAMRQALEGCRIIYASSAPSAEIWEKAKKQKWEKVTDEDEKKCQIQIADMTNYNPQKASFLSAPLQNQINQVLNKKGRVILFMNRRGFSTMTRCNQCGFTVKCPRCDINLTYMYSKKAMICPRCSYQTELPKICPRCQGDYLRSTGTGIERLESEVSRFYPAARIRHYDHETKALPDEADVLIATQAIVKYRNNLKADLIALVDFDSQLNHVDFRSAQKAFALLVHLRQMTRSSLLIQTRMADMYCLRAIKKMDFKGFYRQELKVRKQLGLPPYNHLVAIGLRGVDEPAVFEKSKELYEKLTQAGSEKIEVMDLHPDVIPKLRDKFRYEIVLKGPSVSGMLKITKSLLKDVRRRRGIIVTINVDP